MADPFDAWQKTVMATLKARKRGVTLAMLDPTAVMQAFQSGMSPVAFAIQVNLPMRPPAAPAAAPAPTTPFARARRTRRLLRWGVAAACGLALVMSSVTLVLVIQERRQTNNLISVVREHSIAIGETQNNVKHLAEVSDNLSSNVAGLGQSQSQAKDDLARLSRQSSALNSRVYGLVADQADLANAHDSLVGAVNHNADVANWNNRLRR